MQKFIRDILFFTALFLFVLPVPAYAYLDPGTGSYILQIIVAVFFGGLYAIKVWWRYIKAFIVKHILRKDKKLSEKSSDEK